MLGLREASPALIATGTWGLVTGVAMVKSGMTETLATVMTLTAYAGSAQLTSLTLINDRLTLWHIFAAGFVVTMPFVFSGAPLQPYFRHPSCPCRLPLGAFSSAISLVTFMGRY